MTDYRLISRLKVIDEFKVEIPQSIIKQLFSFKRIIEQKFEETVGNARPPAHEI